MKPLRGRIPPSSSLAMERRWSAAARAHVGCSFEISRAAKTGQTGLLDVRDVRLTRGILEHPQVGLEVIVADVATLTASTVESPASTRFLGRDRDVDELDSGAMLSADCAKMMPFGTIEVAVIENHRLAESHVVADAAVCLGVGTLPLSW